jgi:hypothetical protein
LITPVRDDEFTGSRIGHLIIFKGNSIENRSGKYYSKSLTDNQIATGIVGSFVFVGTNSNIFNHLFKPFFTGKFTEKDVMIDRDYSGVISYEFVVLIRKYISEYKDR